MKKRNFLLAASAGMMIAALFFCSSSFGKTDFTKSDLLKILESEWQAFKSDKPALQGGLAVEILSPQGPYFISTGIGNDVSNAYHFRIASVTKTFTAAGIMLLHQRGALDIDAKITDKIPGKKISYVPDTPEYEIPYKNDITIRMLLMHRAGVFDISNNDIPDNEFSHKEKYVGHNYLDYMKEKDKDRTFTFDELVGLNAKNRLSFFKPGAAYHYSDTGYSMLGKIIERVSGKTYSDFIREELLVPNGLLNTGAPWKGSDQKLLKPFMRGYVWMDPKHVEEVTESNMSPHVAEGNLISTPIDLANWCKQLFTGEAGLKKEIVGMMMSGMSTGEDTGSQYGLGISYVPEAGYGHAGAHEGYLTLMYYRPDTGIAYAMCANNWDVKDGLGSIKNEIKFMTKTAAKILKKMGY